MGKVALKLNGKPLDLTPPLPDSAQKLIAFLSEAPADELYDHRKIRELMKIGLSTLSRILSTYPATLDPYTHSLRGTKGNLERYWGSKAAIAELKRQMA